MPVREAASRADRTEKGDGRASDAELSILVVDPQVFTCNLSALVERPDPRRNLEAEKQRQGSSAINLRFCLTWHSYAVEHEGDLLKPGPPEISDEQTLAAVPCQRR